MIRYQECQHCLRALSKCFISNPKKNCETIRLCFYFKSEIENEIARQDKILNQLHYNYSKCSSDSDKQEELWALQRYITSLKRKVLSLN